VRLRSAYHHDGSTATPHRAFMRAMGLDDDAIARPIDRRVSQKGETTPAT